MKIKLSIDEYAILRYVDKRVSVPFDDIVEHLYINRNRANELLNNLLSRQLIKKNKKYINATPVTCELEQYFFENLMSTKEIKTRIKTPYLWRLRRIFLKTSRKKVRAISIKKDMIDMYRKNKRRIKEAGLKKQKTEQKRWAKRILKSKNKQKITLEIKEQGFFKDKANVIWTKVPILEIVENGIFIVAKKDNWAIEINSNLANFERYEFLTLHTPFNICCFVRVRK